MFLIKKLLVEIPFGKQILDFFFVGKRKEKIDDLNHISIMTDSDCDLPQFKPVDHASISSARGRYADSFCAYFRSVVGKKKITCKADFYFDSIVFTDDSDCVCYAISYKHPYTLIALDSSAVEGGFSKSIEVSETEYLPKLQVIAKADMDIIVEYTITCLQEVQSDLLNYGD